MPTKNSDLTKKMLNLVYTYILYTQKQDLAYINNSYCNLNNNLEETPWQQPLKPWIIFPYRPTNATKHTTAETISWTPNCQRKTYFSRGNEYYLLTKHANHSYLWS